MSLSAIRGAGCNQKPVSHEAGLGKDAYSLFHKIQADVAGGWAGGGGGVEVGSLPDPATGAVVSVGAAFFVEMNFIILVPHELQIPCMACLPFLSVTSCASFMGFCVFSLTQ